MKYRKEIDGLRGLAVLSVIFFHAGVEVFSGGFVGVDVFFVISGYLITTIICSEKQTGTFTLGGFYERRARRILPALFVVMLACLPFAWFWMIPSDLKDFSHSLISVSAFISNFLFWKESGYFDTEVDLKPLLHTWSLAVEEQYYLLFPLFLLLFWRFGRVWIVAILAVVAVLSMALAEWGSVYYPVANFYLLPSRGWELLIGAFIAFYFFEKRQDNFHKLVSELFSLSGIALILYAVFCFDDHTPFPSFYALIPTLGSALVIFFAKPETLAGKILSNKFLVGVGLLSYSAYLWHQPLFAFSKLGFFHVKLNFYILIVLVFVLAYLSWKYIEKPIRYRTLLTGNKAFLSTAVLFSVFFIATGFVGHQTNGFKAYFEKDKLQQLAKIEALGAERNKLIRGGICHFNGQAKSGLKVFLDQWDCFTDQNQINLQKIPLIVTGDSHSADKVIALKLNGYVPLQIGGAGCSLNPKFMTNSCKLIFDKLLKIAKANSYYQYIALANRFSKEELTLESLKDTIDFWQKYDKKIILFTAMPEFPMYRESIVSSRPLRPDFSLANLSEQERVISYLKSRGVMVINTRKIFCAISSDCDYKNSQGDLLLSDKNHLSKVGATRFGAELLKQETVLRSIVGK